MNSESRYKAATMPASAIGGYSVTEFTLSRLHGATGSWRAVGRIIGYSGAYAKLVSEGKRKPSQQAINALHEYMTGERREYQPVQVCPVHGVAHWYDCNGYDDPVVVVKPQRQALPAWVRQATANLAALLER